MFVVGGANLGSLLGPCHHTGVSARYHRHSSSSISRGTQDSFSPRLFAFSKQVDLDSPKGTCAEQLSLRFIDAGVEGRQSVPLERPLTVFPRAITFSQSRPCWILKRGRSSRAAAGSRGRFRYATAPT